MPVLIFITLMWAFSFSLIGEYLATDVDPYLAVFIRMVLAFAVIAPFLKINATPKKIIFYLMAIGGVQIGLMYIFLYHAFLYLTVPEVLLFTIFTPLYITFFDEWVLNRKPIPKRWWIAALVAVIGAGVIRYHTPSTNFLTGFLLIQAANLCFALGQVAYKRLAFASIKSQIQHYALCFLGAALVSGVGWFLFGNLNRIPTTLTHWMVLTWLGIGASGVGYLGWSIASKQVNIGQLATMNNALIPAGILVNYLLWGQQVNWLPFLLGAPIILFSVWLCRTRTAE